MPLLWHGTSAIVAFTNWPNRLSAAISLLVLQVQNQLQPDYFVRSLTAPDGGVHTLTLTDIVSGHKELDFADAQQWSMVRPYVCTRLPGQSDWLQTFMAQGSTQPSSGGIKLPWPLTLQTSTSLI